MKPIWIVALLLATLVPAAAEGVPACPDQPTRVVRSAGGVIEYLGGVPGIPDLCRMRRADGDGEFYMGIWRSDWPGAGLAYPALRAVLDGLKGAHASFVTRSVPGLQFNDSFTNEGTEPITVGSATYQAVRLAHEREGIEGNTYHSVITQWKDVRFGMTLRTEERQISGQSYGPNTTWHATGVEPAP